MFSSLMPRQNGRHFADDISNAFLQTKSVYFALNFTKICSVEFNWQWTSIGSDNSLALNRRKSTIWINTGIVYIRIYASIGLKVLISAITNYVFEIFVYWTIILKFQSSHNLLCRLRTRLIKLWYIRSISINYASGTALLCFVVHMI